MTKYMTKYLQFLSDPAKSDFLIQHGIARYGIYPVRSGPDSSGDYCVEAPKEYKGEDDVFMGPSFGDKIQILESLND